MDSGKSAAGKQSKPSHFDAAARGTTAKHGFITPEPGMSLDFFEKLFNVDALLASSRAAMMGGNKSNDEFISVYRDVYKRQRHGCSMSLFQASQQWSTISSYDLKTRFDSQL